MNIRRPYPAFESFETSALRLLFCGVVVAGLIIATSAVATAYSPLNRWSQDVDAGLKKAEAEGKDVLLLFTGSDWCPPCKKLEEEVLSDEEFNSELRQHFVPVKLDFPREKKLNPAIVEQNKIWASKYGVESYPTVILIDTKRKPFAITGYAPGGAENYLAMLEEFRQAKIQRDENLEAASAVTGLDRAKLLDKAISGMDVQVVEVYYENIVKEIVELDREDQAGLRTKWNAAKDSELRKIIMSDILLISRLEKPLKAISFIDDVLKEVSFPADELLQVLQIKLNLVRQANDPAETDALLDQMINLDGVEGETRERLIVKKVLLMVATGRENDAINLLNKAINEPGGNLHLLKTKGELLAKANKFPLAVKTFDEAIPAAVSMPDLLIELVGAKADALVAMDEIVAALQALDNFADDTQLPSDLRSEALLHKSMVLRDTNRRRQAILCENRALEIAETPAEKAMVQQLISRLRAKYADK